MKLAVLFGGQSTEHDVSVVSGISILKKLDKEKYDILPLYIDENGNWYEYTKDIEEVEVPQIGETITGIKKVENIFEMLKEQDVVFPVLHGMYRRRRNSARVIRICKSTICGV